VGGGRGTARLAALLGAALTLLFHVAAAAQAQPSGTPVPVPGPTESAPAPTAPLPGPEPAPSLPGSRPLPPGVAGPESLPEPSPTAPPPGRVPSTAAPQFGLPLAGAGPLFEFHGGIGIAEEFSSNFSRTENGKANFRTSVSPAGTLLINGVSTRGVIGYSLAGAVDHTSGDINVFHSFLGQVSWQATPRLSFTASESLSRNDDPDQADRLSLRRERRLFTSNTFSLASTYRVDNVSTAERYTLSTFFDENGRDTVTHTLSAGAGAPIGATNSASAGYEFTSSSTSGVDGNVTGHSLNGSLARAVTPLTGVGIAGSIGWRTITAAATGDRDVMLWNVSLFNNYTLPRWSLRGNIGFSRLTDDRGAEFSSISSVSSLTYRFARATASLTADSGFSETFLLGENFGIVETRGITAALVYPLPPSITAHVSAFYRTNDFTGVAGGAEEQGSMAWGASLSLSVQLRRWLTGRFEYAHTRHESSRSDTSFIENRVRVSLDAAF
jgi:hypothetical protein